MDQLERVKEALRNYRSLDGARRFFESLGYPAHEPVPGHRWVEDPPERATKVVKSAHNLVVLVDPNKGRFSIFHVELQADTIRRTDIRRFLEAYYRHNPAGENLFVFSPKDRFDELAFVSPPSDCSPQEITDRYACGFEPFRCRERFPIARILRS